METQVKEQVRRFVEEELVNKYESDKEFILTMTIESFMNVTVNNSITKKFGAEYVDYAREIFNRIESEREEEERKRNEKVREEILSRNEKELSEMFMEIYNKYFSKHSGRFMIFNPNNYDGICVFKTKMRKRELCDGYERRNIFILMINDKLTNEQIEKTIIRFIARQVTEAYRKNDTDYRAELKRIAEEKGIPVEEFDTIIK